MLVVRENARNELFGPIDLKQLTQHKALQAQLSGEPRGAPASDASEGWEELEASSDGEAGEDIDALDAALMQAGLPIRGSWRG